VAPAHYPCAPASAGGGGKQTLQVAPHIGWANAVPDATASVDFTIQGTPLKITGGVGYHDQVCFLPVSFLFFFSSPCFQTLSGCCTVHIRYSTLYSTTVHIWYLSIRYLPKYPPALHKVLNAHPKYLTNHIRMAIELVRPTLPPLCRQLVLGPRPPGAVLARLVRPDSSYT